MIALEVILVIICLVVFIRIAIKEFNNPSDPTVEPQNGTEPQQFAQPQFEQNNGQQQFAQSNYGQPEFEQNHGQQQFAQPNYGQQQFTQSNYGQQQF